MKKIMLLLAGALALANSSQATIRRVNNNPGMNSVYSNVTNAITASQPGDTIHIEGSATSYGSAYLNKRLVLIGPGYFLTDTAANPHTQAVKNPAFSDITFATGSDGSTVEGMILGSVNIADSLITLQRNYLVGNISFANGGHTYGDTLRQNFFASSAALYQINSGQAHGLFFYNNLIEKPNGSLFSISTLSAVSGYFVNNSFVTPPANALNFDCTNFVFQNNIFNKVSFNTATVSSNIFINNLAKTGLPAGNNNQNNIEPADVYAGWGSPGTSSYSSDARYKLKTSSPALNAGILNSVVVDCGAFGGPAPYVLSGMPPIPSIYELTMPSQINSGTPTINVTISAAAH